MASGQRVISSYFSQSNKSSKQSTTPTSNLSTKKPIDLTLSGSGDESPEPPTKRTRIQNDGPSGKRKATSSSPPSTESLLPAASQKWSFTPVTKSTSTSKPNNANAEIEAFRKKMHGDVTKPYIKDKSQGTKRRREPVNVDSASEGNIGEELRNSENSEGEPDEDNLEDEADAVSNWLSKFAINRRGQSGDRSKGNTTQTTKGSGSKGRSSKKTEEIGPAGLKYTPLEKQASKLNS